jgi:hypothetical protein
MRNSTKNGNLSVQKMYKKIAARSLWPCNFFRAFCSSLVYVLDGLPLRRLREWGREDENHVREQKRVLLEERFA